MKTSGTTVLQLVGLAYRLKKVNLAKYYDMTL